MPSALTCAQFLTQVWPEEGPYCLAFPLRDKYKDGRDGYAHRAYETIGEAVTAAMVMSSTENLNVYFATHALKVGWTDVVKKDGSTGRKVSRTHDNMREGRTFFFDLDVGDGDFKYRTREQALSTLQRFLFRTGLPDPLVVSSGGGYHVYFCLETPIASETWREFADRMRWLATTHSLLVDPSRTTDQSSVLRVVGTVNRKPDINAKVMALCVGETSNTEEFTDYLISITEGYTPLATLVRTAKGLTGNLGSQFDGRLTPADEVFNVCEQARTFRDNQGQIPEPMWFALVGLLRWVEDGQELVHELSSGDPRYSFSETQMKIDHWDDKSAPSCAKIELECGNDACDRCPFKGKGKNPIDIANKEWALRAAPQGKPTEAQLEAGIEAHKPPCDAPFPYTVANAGITKIVHDAAQDADVAKVILPYQLFPLAKYKGNRLEAGHSDWCVSIPLEGQSTFSIDDASFHNSQEFATKLMSAGIILGGATQITEAKSFMLHYLNKLQSTAISNTVHDHFGFDYAEGKQDQRTSFVLDKRKFSLKTNQWEPAAMANSMKSFKGLIHQAGSLEGYLDALEFFNRDKYLHIQFIILAGMIVPWQYATGHHGMIVGATGKSGASKSTALAAISACWGPPELLMINASPSGMSANARIDRFQAFPNLPVCLDELTNQSSEAINELALSISQPLGRITLKADRTVRENRSGIRHSIAITSENTSLVTLINASNAAGEAALARINEVDCPRGPKEEKVAADHAIRALRANYGWVGPQSIEALMPAHEQIENEIAAMSDELTRAWELQAVERFSGGLMANMYVTGQHLFNAGLHRFDVAKVGQWYADVQLPKNRQIMETQGERSNPIEVTSSFLADNYAKGIKIDEDGQGNIGAHISIPQSQSLAFRFDIHAKEIWLRSQAFNDYCIAQKLDYGQITSVLKRMGVIVAYERRNLLAGVPNAPVTRTSCYVVNMEHPKITGVVAQVKGRK
jgi:hypothetical protein